MLNNSRLKGDMSLWILTKFAMIFFIFALALIITFFGKLQQEQVCSEQAGLSAKTIASRISQVVYAPVEDERRVYKMPPAIQLGEGRARYELNVTRVVDGETNVPFLSIQLRPIGTSLSCGGGNAVSISGYNLVFAEPTNLLDLKDGSEEETLELHPSELEDPLNKRSKYLVVLKCSTKSLNPSGKPDKYLFLHNCVKDDVNECLQLEGGANNVNGCCGWPGGSCPT